MTPTSRRVVITGLGLLTPLGFDPAAFWAALMAGKSGVRALSQPGAAELPVRIAGELPGFDAKKILSGKEERKSLKMMARTVQMGVACAKLAFADSGVDRAKLDSTRFGIEVGASLIPTDLDDLATAGALCATGEPGGVDLRKWGSQGIREVQPLWMLK